MARGATAAVAACGPALRCAAAWVATRCLLVLLALGVWRLPGADVMSDVSLIYQGWATVLSTGTFPLDDVTWQYPPGAALAMLAPRLLPGLDYTSAFAVLCVVADACVFAVLLRASGGPRGRRPSGPWLWTAGVALLGPTAYARYDLLVTAVAVAGLLAVRRRPGLAGALIGLGALLKLWPALLLAGIPASGPLGRRVWRAAGATCAALTAAAAATTTGAFSFVTFQRDRGIQVESVAGLAFHLARHLGWPGQALLNYGSVEFVGPFVHTAAAVCLLLSAAAFGWLGLWRLRAAPRTVEPAADAAFCAVLLLTTTSRVISPQYLVWLVGMAAACAVRRGGAPTAALRLTLAAAGVTVLTYPLGTGHVMASDIAGLTMLLVRNALLVAATVSACRALWRVPAACAGVSPEVGRLEAVA